jgi:hypothetical protein
VLSQASDYALPATLVLARRLGGGPVRVQEIGSSASRAPCRSRRDGGPHRPAGHHARARLARRAAGAVPHPAGQQVAPHTSPSTVAPTAFSGAGVVSCGDRELAASPGAAVVYSPAELHGVRAAADAAEASVLFATIARRPGSAPHGIGRATPHASAA